MRCRAENGKRENDGERGERPLTASVDDHRRVLPLSRQLGPLVVRPQPPRHRPQLAEDRLQDGAGPTGARRGRPQALAARPDDRRRRRPTLGAVVDRML